MSIKQAIEFVHVFEDGHLSLPSGFSLPRQDQFSLD